MIVLKKELGRDWIVYDSAFFALYSKCPQYAHDGSLKKVISFRTEH